MGSISIDNLAIDTRPLPPTDDDDSTSRGTTIKPHPLGIKPSGNALTASKNLRASIGVFGALPDEFILVLLEWLDVPSLLSLGSTCRALFAFTSNDDLWRTHFINDSPPDFVWRHSWKYTVLGISDPTITPRIDCSDLFSDALHRPYLCSQINLESYCSAIPLNNEITRLTDLSPSEFSAKWSDTPFVLTDVVPKWPIYRDWSETALLKQHGKTVFRAEAVDWPLDLYLDYMETNTDESPLYLFDKDFVRKMKLQTGQGGAYFPPDSFGEDLFELLGESRPDNRWLIIGPKRSGSTFHKDPNATSAWNAVIKGAKYWILFPPHVQPPGVYMSADQSEVTSPLSIAEWLLTFQAEARDMPECIEGVCGEGEVLHVPSGWWHLVVNLDSAVAITQNFIPKAHLKSAIRFLKDKADQVSGFSKEITDPHTLFMRRLEEQHPELLEELDSVFVGRKRKWEDLVLHQEPGLEDRQTDFSFGFGGSEEDDID